MANIDLLDLEPTTISRDLRGKYVLLYGAPKVGKTTFASSFPKNLFLSTEQGTNALPSVYAVNIENWSAFKRILSQLKKEEVQEKYNTVTIDTITILWDLCEKYVCQQNGVEAINQIPYGGGYSQLGKEFSEAMRQITLMPYGLVFIAHSETGMRKNSYTGEDEEFVRPSLNKRCYAIANRLVDAIIYIDNYFDEEGQSIRRMITRETPTVFAGSRFRFLKPVINNFGYQAFADAVYEAIEMEGKMGATVVDTPVRRDITASFDEVMEEAASVWKQLLNKNPDNAAVMADVVTQIFGRPTKLSTVTEDQQELLESAVSALKKLLD